MTRWHLKHERHGSEPWAVQAEAMRRAGDIPKWGNFLEQGLGKTSLTLNEFVDFDDVDLMAVIAPNSFKIDWVLAPDEWGVPFIPTGMWPKDPLPFDDDIGLYSVNYEAVRGETKSARGGSAIRPLMELMDRRRVMLVIDESYAIGNPASQTTRGVIELSKRATKVRLLNGTPMPESVENYYGQLRALGKLYGMLPTQFRNRYAVKGGYFGKKIVGMKNEAELAAILDSCSFRALKKDWRKDLPPQIEVPVHLEMTNKQRSHYATMMDEFYAAVSGDDVVTADLVLTQMDKLRQISSCVLMDKGKHFWLEEPKDNPKVKATIDLIEGGQGKCIVSYMYKPTGDMLFDILSKRKFKPARIKGGMDPEDIKLEKARFNNDSDCRVLLGQQVATARGHTLLGQAGKDRCNRIVMFENHFGLYWYEQIKDRNHRGEQDEECHVFHLITSPIDQTVYDGLVDKRNKAEAMDAVVKAVHAYKEQRTR